MTYREIFNQLLRRLLERRVVKGEVIAVDSTHVEAYGAEPIIPVRRYARVRDALRVGRDFVVGGARRLVELFSKRWIIERLFSRANEWLMQGSLKVRYLEQVAIHAALSLIAMLAVALTAVHSQHPDLMRSIRHFTA